MKRILMTGCLAAACSFAAAAAAPADELEGLLGRLRRAEAMAGGAVKNDSVASVCADLSGYYNYISADSSRLYAERGLALLPDTPSELHATLLNNCANAFFSAGDMPRAKEWLFRTLREAEALGIGSLRIDALSALGVVYRRCEMPDSAFVCYSRAAELAEASGEESSVANLYINIAVLYANTRRLDEALVYARKGLERSLRSDETGQQLYAYQTLGSIQVLLERREEAAATLRDAYALAVRADMPTFVVKCAAPLISNFTLLGRPDSVRRYISLTEPYLGRVAPGSVEGLGYKEVIAQFYLNTGRYGESLRLYRELLAEEGNLATPRPLLLNRIARAEAGLGRYAEAYRTMAECYAVQDSVSGARFQEQLSDFSARYDAQQKELEIATLREERALQRVSTMRYVVWSVVLIVLLAAAVSLLLFLRRRQIARGRAREREFEAFRRQTDLRLARKYIDGLEAERTRLAREHAPCRSDPRGAARGGGAAGLDARERAQHFARTDAARAAIRHARRDDRRLHIPSRTASGGRSALPLLVAGRLGRHSAEGLLRALPHLAGGDEQPGPSQRRDADRRRAAPRGAPDRLHGPRRRPCARPSAAAHAGNRPAHRGRPVADHRRRDAPRTHRYGHDAYFGDRAMTAAGHAEKLALLLVDDHELILLGIRQSLEREGTAGDLVAVRSAAEALQALRSRRFDLCVVDLELPDLPGFELIDAIRRQDPAARIVVNTMHNEIWTVNRLLQSGVQGVVMKDSDAGELARAVRAVAFGGRYFCPRFEQLRRRLLCGSGPDPLTRREQEVLERIAEGHSTAEIARRMSLSQNTVETYRKHLFAKLGARNSVDLTMRAVARGLIRADLSGREN